MLRSVVRAPHAVFAPVMVATLSLSSLASAQEPATAEAPAAVPAPEAAAVPVAPVESVAPAAPAAAAPAATAPQVVASDEVHTLPARAPARLHEGFYLRLTSGPTFLTLNGHGPYGSASLTGAGAGGMIAIGGAVAPGFVLAGTIGGSAFNAEFNGGPFENGTVLSKGKTYTASDRATGGFGTLGILVDWYPEPRGGWHVGGAAGLGVIVLTNAADDRDFGGVNFAGNVFGGYDWSLGRKWSLGLQLVVGAGTRSKLVEEDETQKNDTRDTGYRLTPFSVGVQASLLYF